MITISNSERYEISQNFKSRIPLRKQVHDVPALVTNKYSSAPKEAFFRHTLQNAQLALTARKKLGQTFNGKVEVIMMSAGSGETLSIEDNGIGMNFDDVNQCLGKLSLDSISSHTDHDIPFPWQFLGGTLGSLIVADKVTIITCKADSPALVVRWTSRQNGNWLVEEIEGSLQPGTLLFLTLKPEILRWLTPEEVQKMVANYSKDFSWPVTFRHSQEINLPD